MARARPAQPRDYDRVLTLLMEIHDHHVELAPGVFVRSSPALLTPEAFSERLADPAQAVLVIEEAGDVLGFAYLMHVRRPANAASAEREYLAIEQFGVRRARQRQGYGRQLIEAVVAEASRRRVARLDLSVWVGNARALAFYERLGFRTYLQRMEYIVP